MEHHSVEKMSSTSLMLPKEKTNEKLVIVTPSGNGVGKILIREDTILANLQGCAGCGRKQFTCGRVKSPWSALCWGKHADKNYYCLLLVLTITFFVSLVGAIFFCSTNTINNVILSNMVIKNNSMAYRLWQKPSVQPFMKVHIFNYTNWNRVREGLDERLAVEDVGPFVYSQQLERVNIKFHDEKLTFREKNTFMYRPDLSSGGQLDYVNVPNLPLLSVVSKAISLRLPVLALMSLNSVLLWTDHPKPFLKLPVHGFLWGYDDNIIVASKPILSLQGLLKFERFGLLVMKNGTTSEQFTINTGIGDIDKMNIIEQIDGKDYLSQWANPECNSIDSTDGTIFPTSMLDRKATLYVFFPNLCRRVPFIYDKDVETEDGVVLLRYRMPSNVFDDPSLNPSNQCFCDVDTGVCPPRGIVNVSSCIMGAPVLASFPHFYLGDEEFTRRIDGIDPDANLHNSYIDIHPTLGIAIGGKISIQINIQVKKSTEFYNLNFLEQDLILPIAWIEVTSGELSDEFRALIYHGTYSTAAAQLALSWGCIITVVITGICLLVVFVRRKRRPCAIVKTLTVETELANQSENGTK